MSNDSLVIQLFVTLRYRSSRGIYEYTLHALTLIFNLNPERANGLNFPPNNLKADYRLDHKHTHRDRNGRMSQIESCF